MPSIFNESDMQSLIQRIDQLNGQSQPLWGKMNAAQMLAHLQEVCKALQGKTGLKRGLIGYLFGAIAKKRLLSEKPIQKNLPTAPSFVVKDERDLATEKQKTVEMLHEIQRNGSAGVTKDPHPFFGTMNAEEWDRLTWKHIDHHLKQFGV